MKKFTEEYIQKRVKWYYECYDYIELAEYKKATAHAKKGLKLFPDDTVDSFIHWTTTTYNNNQVQIALILKFVKYSATSSESYFFIFSLHNA